MKVENELIIAKLLSVEILITAYPKFLSFYLSINPYAPKGSD